MENTIRYYSTNLKAPKVSFREALIKGLAPDRGLYMPDSIPQLSFEEINSFSSMEYYEIAYSIIKKYLQNEMEDTALMELVKDAYNYSVPLEKVYENKFIMRLDQGPTASFKDFAARFMGRAINHYMKKENRKLVILTATSGDTGSAIANAFYGLDSIKVIVLFPEKEVTNRQRKQMTTLGKNIQILSLDGKFDDCQALVKTAFSDPELGHMNLSSANSINIGRLVPQIVYYFYSFSRLRNGNNDEKVVFSVPSGNFGDMMGGVLAMKMGLPVKRFIIATNENDEFPVLLRTQKYNKIEPSINCISSAMNVGHPSNLSRLVALYGGIMDEQGNISRQPDYELMNRELFAVSINDIMTRTSIKETYENHGVLLEPHGAVGWAGVKEYIKEYGNDPNQLIISLETAHPAKFPEEINRILSIDPKLPPSLEGIEDKEEFTQTIENNYKSFKEFLIDNVS